MAFSLHIMYAIFYLTFLFPGGKSPSDRRRSLGWRAVHTVANKVAVHLHVLGDAAPAHTRHARQEARENRHGHGGPAADYCLGCSQW